MWRSFIDPLNRTDPSGNFECEEGAGGVVICTYDPNSFWDRLGVAVDALVHGWTPLDNANAMSSGESEGDDSKPTSAPPSDQSSSNAPAAGATSSPPPEGNDGGRDDRRQRESRRSRGDRFKSGDDAHEQLKQIDEAQRKVRKGESNQIIDSIRKSEQRADHALKPQNIDWGDNSDTDIE